MPLMLFIVFLLVVIFIKPIKKALSENLDKVDESRGYLWLIVYYDNEFNGVLLDEKWNIIKTKTKKATAKVILAEIISKLANSEDYRLELVGLQTKYRMEYYHV